MAEARIPEEVAALLRERIDTVDELGILLLLGRARPTSVAPSVIARELLLDHAVTVKSLEALRDRGLVAEDPREIMRYRLAPKTPELDGAVSGLAWACALHREAVLSIISAKSAGRGFVLPNLLRRRRMH